MSIYCRYFYLILFISAASLSYAQDNLQLDYDLTAESVISSGAFAPYMMTANRHDIVSAKPNSGNFQFALLGNKQVKGHWSMAGGIQMIVSTDYNNKLYLQELYLRLNSIEFYFEIGSRQKTSPVLNSQLSSGDLVFSGNSKPIPMILGSTNGFISIPIFYHQIETFFDFGYGMLLDGDWIEDCFEDNSLSQKYSFFTRDVYFHHKQMYLRTNSHKRFYGTLGMQHSVLFSGIKTSYETGIKEISGRGLSFGDFFRVIIPQSDDTETVAGDSFVFGNHVGNWYLDFAGRLTKSQSLKIYMEKPFEDGSGIAFRNGLDGLWGIEYSDSEDRKVVKSCVFEYIQTTNQSGPIHWAPADVDQSISDKLPNEATGADNYYNNFFYNGYAHFGKSIGSALLKSPYYNKDGYLNFVDNRIQAWHFGINGDLSSSLSYLVKLSYREGLGTYFVPLPSKHHSFDSIFQLNWTHGPWQCAASCALTNGNIYGNSAGLDLKVTYHGKIL